MQNCFREFSEAWKNLFVGRHQPAPDRQANQTGDVADLEPANAAVVVFLQKPSLEIVAAAETVLATP